MKSDLFIGILGGRYGWVPDKYDISKQEGLEWLNTMKKGCSITELEMRAFLQKRDSQSKAFFYLRDESFIRWIVLPLCVFFKVFLKYFSEEHLN